MDQLILEIIVLVCCAGVAAFFSGAESALFSITKPAIHRLSQSKNQSEKLLYGLMKEPQKILITILTGNLFANLVISTVSAKLLLKQWPHWGHLISIAIVAPVLIIFCEITPKIIALHSFESTSKKLLPLLRFFHILLLPVRLLLLLFTDAMIRMFGLKFTRKKTSKDELGLAVNLGERHGVIGKDEGTFLKNVIRFSKMDASNIMFPRNSAVFLPYGVSISRAMKTFLAKGVIRVPVYRGDLDHVIGIVDSRELIPYHLGYKKARNINHFIRPVRFFPASRELHELLSDFISGGIQMAVLVDEYGGTAGIITLNKILSELMGRDIMKWEDDSKHEVKKVDDNVSIISGEMLIDDFNELFGEELESQDADSVGGYIIEKVSYIPKRGEELRTRKHFLRIRNVRRNKIEAVEVVQRKDAEGAPR